MRLRLALAALVLVTAAAVSGCAGNADDPETIAVAAVAASPDAAPAPAVTETGSALADPTLTLHESRYGVILSDGRGFALYAFTADGPDASRCHDECAEAWPPYLVDREPAAGAGVDPALLGSTRRTDGTRQATYGGRPLYYYVGDREPGQVLCQDVFEFGGRWLVLRGSGELVT